MLNFGPGSINYAATQQELWAAEFQQVVQNAMFFGRGVYVESHSSVRHMPIESLQA